MSPTETKHKKKSTLLAYWPLVCLVLVALVAGCAASAGIEGGLLDAMHYFMGFLFCQFAMLKLFNISGFADGFQMYDIIAKKTRMYALAYPFIELALGLAYLSFFLPIVTYLVTIAFMIVGSIGVIQSLREGLDIYCPCMGTVLKVPLSTVTLTEDLGMGIMAFFMLIERIF